MRLCVLRLCIFLLFVPLIYAENLSGRVIGVSDGDTITVLDSNKIQHKIRLAEIDTPEKNQAYGSKAKQSLSDKIFSKDVRIEYDTKDRYGRIVGKVIFEDRWINREMISEGFAWHYKHYSKDTTLAEAEESARDKKLGLWQDENPIPPWDFRRAKSSTKKTEVPADAEYWLNTGSGTRHNNGCKYFNKTKGGRFCGPNEGKPCGMCGG